MQHFSPYPSLEPPSERSSSRKCGFNHYLFSLLTSCLSSLHPKTLNLRLLIGTMLFLVGTFFSFCVLALHYCVFIFFQFLVLQLLSLKAGLFSVLVWTCLEFGFHSVHHGTQRSTNTSCIDGLWHGMGVSHSCTPTIREPGHYHCTYVWK